MKEIKMRLFYILSAILISCGGSPVPPESVDDETTVTAQNSENSQTAGAAGTGNEDATDTTVPTPTSLGDATVTPLPTYTAEADDDGTAKVTNSLRTPSDEDAQTAGAGDDITKVTTPSGDALANFNDTITDVIAGTEGKQHSGVTTPFATTADALAEKNQNPALPWIRPAGPVTKTAPPDDTGAQTPDSNATQTPDADFNDTINTATADVIGTNDQPIITPPLKIPDSDDTQTAAAEEEAQRKTEEETAAKAAAEAAEQMCNFKNDYLEEDLPFSGPYFTLESDGFTIVPHLVPLDDFQQIGVGSLKDNNILSFTYSYNLEGDYGALCQTETEEEKRQLYTGRQAWGKPLKNCDVTVKYYGTEIIQTALNDFKYNGALTVRIDFNGQVLDFTTCQ